MLGGAHDVAERFRKVALKPLANRRSNGRHVWGLAKHEPGGPLYLYYTAGASGYERGGWILSSHYSPEGTGGTLASIAAPPGSPAHYKPPLGERTWQVGWIGKLDGLGAAGATSLRLLRGDDTALRYSDLLVTARQRLAFAAALALHDGFVLAPREYSLTVVRARRPGGDGRRLRALALDVAVNTGAGVLAPAYRPAFAVMRRAGAQGWAWLESEVRQRR